MHVLDSRCYRYYGSGLASRVPLVSTQIQLGRPTQNRYFFHFNGWGHDESPRGHRSRHCNRRDVAVIGNATTITRPTSLYAAMTTLVLQIIALLLLAVAMALAWVSFPYPSPLVRWLLPPRKRWPEMQIRKWLVDGRFHATFLNYFYRDPERMPPPGSSILAPADGLITSVDIRDEVRYVVIALSFWDMHVQRSPFAGRIVSVTAHGRDFMDGEGREFVFLREKTCPVQKRLVIETRVGELAVRLITSLAARRIETWVKEGDEIERGQRIGRILLGSTVVIELPVAADLRVKVGERVRAGETMVAEMEPLS